MAKEKKPSSKSSKHGRIPVDPSKKAQAVPVTYLRFLDAALTDSVFRQTLQDVSNAKSGDPQWNAMVSQLTQYHVVEASDATKISNIMTQLVAVNWEQIYSVEQALERKPDSNKLDGKLDILDA